MDNGPFRQFRVLPFFGAGRTAVEWTLAPQVPSGEVHIYRSASGLAKTWEHLTAGNPQTGRSGSFVDTGAADDSAFDDTHYRGLLDVGGTLYPADSSIKALDQCDRRDWLLAVRILRNEYRNMAMPGGRGLRVLYYVPKEGGAPASNAIPETGQILGPGCANDPAFGFGTPYAGGFHPPVLTWVLQLADGEEQTRHREDGTGDLEEIPLKLRLLAHPKPREGHVIVFADTDRRYVVRHPIQPFRCRGAIPAFWEVGAVVLPRGDARQLLLPPPPVPPPDPVPGTPLVFGPAPLVFGDSPLIFSP